MRVAAVVCHHRSPAIAATLASLAQQSVVPVRVLVIDNASGPGWAERIREAAPWAEVVAAQVNRGYAAAMNLGVRLLSSDEWDAVALMTHEVQAAPDALAILAERLAADPSIGAVGPLLVWGSDRSRVWSAGGVIDRRTWRVGHRNDPADVAVWREAGVREADWLDGAFMLVRRDAFERAGGLDESYFLYFEEVDFCLRLRRAGLRVECVPAAVASQESAGVPVYLAHRNRFLFLRRWARGRLAAESGILARQLGGHLVHGRRAAVGPALRGGLAGLFGRCGPPPARAMRVRYDPEWRHGLGLVVSGMSSPVTGA